MTLCNGVEVRARSGHVLRVADKAAADRWVARGYQVVEDAPKPAKTAARKTSRLAKAVKKIALAGKKAA